ncbi:MAG: hypothetical protein R2873_26250 [Caldilineaceae bacterium]
MVTMSAQRIVPVLAAIIEQGVKEGVFAVDYPAEAAEVSLQIGTALGETFVRLLLTQEQEPERTETARRKVHALRAQPRTRPRRGGRTGACD